MSDLKKFQRLFQEDKLKVYPTKLEYRGINNLERTIAQANQIITANRLKLVVNSSGALASYKAFEVILIADQEAAVA
jgi:hypothetical protein